jgi:hypothetical protein
MTDYTRQHLRLAATRHCQRAPHPANDTRRTEEIPIALHRPACAWPKVALQRLAAVVRSKSLVPALAILLAAGCATCPPRISCAPCTPYSAATKPAPVFDMPASTLQAWALLEARQAVESTLDRAAAQTAVAEVLTDEERQLYEMQAAFEINRLQAQFDELVRP